MSATLVVALSLLLNALLPYCIVKRDLRRLGPEPLSRAWPDASFLSAVLAFGPLSLPVHFTKTRRSLLGFGLGFAWCAACVLLEALATAGLGAALGIE